jgi:hypothetical protein
MKYIIGYRLKGLMKDTVFIHGVLKYDIQVFPDYIEIEYDKEYLQWIFFGKKTVVHIKRLFMKDSLAELGVRESIREKFKEVVISS